MTSTADNDWEPFSFMEKSVSLFGGLVGLTIPALISRGLISIVENSLLTKADIELNNGVFSSMTGYNFGIAGNEAIDWGVAVAFPYVIGMAARLKIYSESAAIGYVLGKTIADHMRFKRITRLSEHDGLLTPPRYTDVDDDS